VGLCATGGLVELSCLASSSELDPDALNKVCRVSRIRGFWYGLCFFNNGSGLGFRCHEGRELKYTLSLAEHAPEGSRRPPPSCEERSPVFDVDQENLFYSRLDDHLRGIQLIEFWPSPRKNVGCACWRVSMSLCVAPRGVGKPVMADWNAVLVFLGRVNIV